MTLPQDQAAATAPAPAEAAARGRIGAAVHQNPAASRTGLLERGFSTLFQGLVYAQIWEDPVADMTALDIRPGDRIVCIASGGCNMMSYLIAEPERIDAVDLSPAHVALGRLKLAAAARLDQFDDFWRLFGRADDPANVELYERVLAPALDREAQAWWEARRGLSRRTAMLAGNLYRFGALGRFLGVVHALARNARVDLRRILSCTTLEDQRAVFEADIAPLFDLTPVRWLARRRASLFGLGIPPAQYDKLAADGGGDVIPVLRERVRKLACDFPVADNYFAWAAFNRGYQREEPRSAPPYLDRGNFSRIKAGAPRVSLMNISLTEFLAAEADASRDVYVLLDAQDWMTDAQLTALWREITRTARTGARVLFRTGGADDFLPGRVGEGRLDSWTRDAAASARATAEDRSAIYGGVHLYRLAQAA